MHNNFSIIYIFYPFSTWYQSHGLQEDSDISKAIIDYINANYVHDIIIGAFSRNALMK